MRIIPAVDLLDGNVVRLRRGVFSDQTIYSRDPSTTVKEWLNKGAEIIHIVDLNGSKGENTNRDLMKRLVASFAAKLQVAGGIKSKERALDLLEQGVLRIVIGSAAANKEAWVKALLANEAERIVIALDIDDEKVRVNGWQSDSNYGFCDLLETMIEWGAIHFLVTDISKDGMREGPNVALYRKLKVLYPQVNLIASGGISSNGDFALLRRVGIAEAVVGKALYTGDVVLGDNVAYGGYCHDN